MTTKSPTDAAAALEAEPLAYGSASVTHSSMNKANNLHRALLRENVIKVEIGPNHTEYYVHPGLLSHHSEYFKRALNGSWKEAEDWMIMLEDVECPTCQYTFTNEEYRLTIAQLRSSSSGCTLSSTPRTTASAAQTRTVPKD